MKESTDDGITVRIAYEPRLARVILSDEQAKEIKKYYEKCVEDGSNPEQVEESKRAMSEIKRVLGHPDRLKRLAKDIVTHYDALCAEKPKIVQKAMIVCADRTLAFKVYKEIKALRSDWVIAKQAEDKSALSKDETRQADGDTQTQSRATQGADDEKALFDPRHQKNTAKI